jgi:hypothetical protein
VTPDADAPEVAVEAMASGAMLHPCEIFFVLHYAKNVAWEQRSLSGNFFSCQKSMTPFLTWTVFNANNRALFLY